MLSGIEEQVSRANQHKEQQLALKQQIESEVSGCSREQPKPLTLKQLETVLVRGFAEVRHCLFPRPDPLGTCA